MRLLFIVSLSALFLPMTAWPAPATAPARDEQLFYWRSLSLPFSTVIDSLKHFAGDEIAPAETPDPEDEAKRDALARYLDARLLAQKGETQKAIEALGKSQSGGTDHLAAQLAVVSISMESGDLNGALTAAQNLTESQPESYEARVALGRVYMAMLEKKPDDADLHLKAIQTFEQARKIKPNGIDALQVLGEMYWGDFRRSRTSRDEAATATNVIDVYKQILELSRGNERLLPLLYLAFTHQIVGKLDEAEGYFKRAIEIEPRNIPAYIQLAGLYESKKDKDKVIQTLRQALVIDPSAANVQERLNEYLSRESPEAVLEFYKDLAEDFQSSPEFQKMYALQLIAAQKPLEAIEAYQQIVRLDEGDADSRAILAHLLIQHNRKADAVDPLRQLETLGASDAESLRKAAALYLQGEMPEDAERVFKEALKISPPEQKMEYLTYLVAFYLHRKENEKALAVLDAESSQLDETQQYDLQLERARILQGLSRTQESEETLKALIGKDPAKPTAYLQLGMLYDATSRDKEAEEVYRQLLQKMPQKAEAYIGLGALYEGSGREELAEESYRKVLEFDANNVDALLALGMLFDKRDEVAEAEKVYRKAISLDPANADAHNNLGYLFAVRGIRLEESQVLIEKALELSPDAPHIMDSMGWVLYQQGKYEEALRHLEPAAAQATFDASNAEVFEHLGDAYEKLGRQREAMAVYKKALQADPKRESVVEKVVRLQGASTSPATNPVD